jgi:hypothetical protein
MNRHGTRRVAVILGLSLAVGACAKGEAGSGGDIEVGLKLSDTATAADVGLPAYPGSKPYVESGDSSSAANLGLNTPLFGFKVVALKLQVAAAPDRVAAFYRQALSKYGKVLDCSAGVDAPRKSKADTEDDAELTCDADETDDLVFKAGTENNQRIVAIKPYGTGTQFNLVHVDVRGDSKQ